jgi:predicted DNA-binding ribbon-helix-helix protein
MRKRSIAIEGHRTSILLEPEFWAVLDRAAASRGLTLPKLVAEIDRIRTTAPRPQGLASALRVFALEAAASGTLPVDDEA